MTTAMMMMIIIIVVAVVVVVVIINVKTTSTITERCSLVVDRSQVQMSADIPAILTECCCFVFLSPTRKIPSSTSDYAMTASLQILSNSLFISHPTIRRHQ